MSKYDEFRPGINGTFREDGYRDAIKDLDPSPPDIDVLADEYMQGYNAGLITLAERSQA